jgi:uncharacterized membrane protein
MTQRRFPATLAATALLLVGLALPAGAKKPPKPPPEPPPEPGLTYSLTELDVSAGFVSSQAIGTNAAGAAAGSTESDAGVSHAAVWPTASDPPIDLGSDFESSAAYALNSHGEVVGVADEQPVIWVPGPGGYEAIVLSTGEGDASDINEDGVVTGTVTFPGSGDLAYVVVPEDFDGDGLLDWYCDENPTDGFNDLLVLLEPDSFFTLGININDYGWVAGGGFSFVVIPDDMNGDGLLDWFWDANGDGWNDLSTGLPKAFDINNLGQVVDDDLLMQLELSPDGTVTYTATTLPLPRKITSLSARAINDAGMVVGKAASRQGPKAFIWETEAGTTMLQDLVTDMATFDKLEEAWDINLAGQIVGTGTTDDGERGFLATPNE